MNKFFIEIKVFFQLLAMQVLLFFFEKQLKELRNEFKLIPIPQYKIIELASDIILFKKMSNDILIGYALGMGINTVKKRTFRKIERIFLRINGYVEICKKL